MTDSNKDHVCKMIREFEVPSSDAFTNCGLSIPHSDPIVWDAAIYISTQQSQNYYTDVFQFWVRSREDFLNKSGSTGFKGSRKNAIETLGKFTQRNMQIVDEVKKVASEVQKSPAEVALAWLLSKSAVTSVLLGASKLEQLENNLGSLNTHLSPDQIKRLDDISRVEMGFPHVNSREPNGSTDDLWRSWTPS